MRHVWNLKGDHYLKKIHGGIKTYQWVNIPLALVGRVDKKDGTTVNISVGFDENDPIFLVTDLAPHVDSPNRKRTSRDVGAL